MFLVVVGCILLGCILTLFIEAYLIYKHFMSLPVVEPPTVPQNVECQMPKELLKIIEEGSWKDKKEPCISLNLIFLALFREWKDTTVVRRWMLKKLQWEFLELQKSITGKLLEQITVRDLQLGTNFPVIKNIQIDDVTLHKTKKTIENLDFTLDMEYAGGFQLAIDANMVLGRKAFLSVCVTSLKGKARLQLTRNPFTHWSFTFYEEPLVDFSVESHFQGRPLPQITSLIITQIRRTLRKKHTLPNYKMRFRPFFQIPELPSYQVEVPANKKYLFEGSLEVIVVECSRLANIAMASQVYCALALDSTAWVELVQVHGRTWVASDLEIVRQPGQSLGILFKQDIVADKCDFGVVVETVSPNSPAALAGVKKDDIIVSIGHIQVQNSKQAVKLFKQMGNKFVISVERKSTIKSAPSLEISEEDQPADLEKQPVFEESRFFPYMDEYVHISLRDVESSSHPDLSTLHLPDESQSGKSMDGTEEKTLAPRRVSVSGVSLDSSLREKSFLEDDKKDRSFDNFKQDGEQAQESEDILTITENHTELKKTTPVEASQEPCWNEKFTFNVTSHHCFLNIGVWCKPSLLTGSTAKAGNISGKGPRKDLLGYAIIPILPILEECSCTTQGSNVHVAHLLPPSSQLSSQWKKLSSHSGFDHRLCYGDITLIFRHINRPFICDLPKQMKKTSGKVKEENNVKQSQEKEKGTDSSKRNVDPIFAKKIIDVTASDSAAESEDEYVNIEAIKKIGDHDFISTIFHTATICDFCHKKIWLKAAFQCRICAMICHKKCMVRCQAQSSCPFDKTKCYIEDIVNTYRLDSTADSESPSKKSESFFGLSPSKSSQPAAPSTTSPGLHRKKLQNLLSNLTNTGQPKSSMTRTGSAHNLAPPAQEFCPVSKSLPPSPQHSPAQSRKCSLQESNFPWRDPTTLEEQDLNAIVEKLLTLPHDEVVLSAAKERGKELYAGLSLEDRKDKLNLMIAKVQDAIDAEAENRNELIQEEHELTSPSKKAKLAFLISKSDERTQALAVLMLHYLSGLQHCQDQEEIHRSTMSLDARPLGIIPSVNILDMDARTDNDFLVGSPDEKECDTTSNLQRHIDTNKPPATDSSSHHDVSLRGSSNLENGTESHTNVSNEERETSITRERIGSRKGSFFRRRFKKLSSTDGKATDNTS